MDYDDFIEDVFRSVKPTDNYIYNKQLINELFRTTYGIADHFIDTSPMLANKFTEAHKFTDGFIYEEHLRNFIYKDIGKKLGMSFDDYINRPRYEIQNINKVIDHLDAEKAKINQSLVDSLSGEVGKNKKDTSS